MRLHVQVGVLYVELNQTSNTLFVSKITSEISRKHLN